MDSFFCGTEYWNWSWWIIQLQVNILYTFGKTWPGTVAKNATLGPLAGFKPAPCVCAKKCYWESCSIRCKHNECKIWSSIMKYETV
jgi:hypothetical protein